MFPIDSRYAFVVEFELVITDERQNGNLVRMTTECTGYRLTCTHWRSLQTYRNIIIEVVLEDLSESSISLDMSLSEGGEDMSLTGSKTKEWKMTSPLLY